MSSLSVCIMAKDEEMYIGSAIKSVQAIADEIIVVTSTNIDRTVEIAKSLGARIEHAPKGFSIVKNGFSEYKNLGLDKCTKIGY